MTTRDFIARTYNTESNRERFCSSVFTDSKGIVYSYGYHYPLAIRVAGLDVVNTAGYSATTAKHINWARQALGYDAIGAKLSRHEGDVLSSHNYSTSMRLQALKQALYREHSELVEEMASKKRKDTQVYRHLEHELARVTKLIKRVQEVA